MKNDQTPQKGAAFKKLSFGKTNKKVKISGKSDNLKKDYRKKCDNRFYAFRTAFIQ